MISCFSRGSHQIGFSWGLSPGNPLKIGGGILTLGGAPGPGGGSAAAANCIACTNCARRLGPPGPLPGGGGGGAPGPLPGGGGGGAPAPPAPAPAPAGGGGGAAIINAHLSWLLSLTLCPNTALYASALVACAVFY